MPVEFPLHLLRHRWVRCTLRTAAAARNRSRRYQLLSRPPEAHGPCRGSFAKLLDIHRFAARADPFPREIRHLFRGIFPAAFGAACPGGNGCISTTGDLADPAVFDPSRKPLFPYQRVSVNDARFYRGLKFFFAKRKEGIDVHGSCSRRGFRLYPCNARSWAGESMENGSKMQTCSEMVNLRGIGWPGHSPDR